MAVAIDPAAVAAAVPVSTDPVRPESKRGPADLPTKNDELAV